MTGDWESFEFERADAPRLRFEGREVSVVDNMEWAKKDRRNQYTELAVFELKSGGYALARGNCSLKEGQRDLYEFERVKSLEDGKAITGFFGWKTLAKELYEELGIDGDAVVEEW